MIKQTHLCIWTTTVAAYLTFLPLPASADQDCLTILSSFTKTEQQILPSLQAKFAEYEICAKFKFARADEATALLQDNSADGEFLRTSDYQAKVSDFAMMIAEPIVDGHGLLVTGADVLPSFKHLKGKSIGVMHGYVWQEKVFPKDATKSFIQDYKSGLAMLQRGQISGLLIDSLNYSIYKENYGNLQTKQVTAKKYGYLFLHNRHKNLAPQISWAITAWKKEFYRVSSN
ncbi:hypothetical protein [Roseibium sp.]|uniref:hypothetical protein n=1 Tax=Roseibium sp. TaxID=1936156 RepID=UPI003B51A488